MIGYALQRLVLNRTLGDDLLPPLLVTFGLSVIIQNGLLAAVHRRQPQAAGRRTSRVASFPLVRGRLRRAAAAAVVCGRRAVIAALQFVFYRTALGRAFRATTDDPSVPQLMGARQPAHFALAMALSLAVVAVAGVFWRSAPISIRPSGRRRLIFGFEAVIIGGLGSLWGTLAGGMILGVAQAIGAQIDPGWQRSPAISLFWWCCGAARRPVPEGAQR